MNITCEIFFIKHHAENNAGRLVPDHFLNFKKALYKAKASGQHLGRPKLGLTIKTTLYNITGCWSRDMLNFDFLQTGSGTNFSITFSV